MGRNGGADAIAWQEALKKEERMLDLWARRSALGQPPAGDFLHAPPWDASGEVACASPGQKMHAMHLGRGESAPDLWASLKTDVGVMNRTLYKPQMMSTVKAAAMRQPGATKIMNRRAPAIQIACPWATGDAEPMNSVYDAAYNGAAADSAAVAGGRALASFAARSTYDTSKPYKVETREAPFAACTGAPTEFYRRVTGPTGDPPERRRTACARPSASATRRSSSALIAPYVDIVSADGGVSTVVRPGGPGPLVAGPLKNTASMRATSRISHW